MKILPTGRGKCASDRGHSIADLPPGHSPPRCIQVRVTGLQSQMRGGPGIARSLERRLLIVFPRYLVSDRNYYGDTADAKARARKRTTGDRISLSFSQSVRKETFECTLFARESEFPRRYRVCLARCIPREKERSAAFFHRTLVYAPSSSSFQPFGIQHGLASLVKR